MATNMVVLVGRLTKDVQVGKTNSGLSYAKFTVAVDRPRHKAANTQQPGGYQQQPVQQPQKSDADFIGCTAWRQQAEYLGAYAHKGDLISVEGRIQTSTYTDQTGQQRWSTDVQADRVSVLTRKNAGMAQPVQQYAQPAQPQYQQPANGGYQQQPRYQQQPVNGGYKQPAQPQYAQQRPAGNGYQQPVPKPQQMPANGGYQQPQAASAVSPSTPLGQMTDSANVLDSLGLTQDDLQDSLTY